MQKENGMNMNQPDSRHSLGQVPKGCRNVERTPDVTLEDQTTAVTDGNTHTGVREVPNVGATQACHMLQHVHKRSRSYTAPRRHTASRR